jgi:proteasome lid subunit RPN8/RPN11
MVSVLEVQMVEAIASIGRYRAPAEACGLLLPVPTKARSVWELPNRSKTPQTDFECSGEDMLLLLEQIYDGDDALIRKLLEEGALTVWHTHPSGNVGPSLFDLRNKPAHLKCLVVTLPEKGKPLATWY